jgi:RNA polymerase sigma-70 factor (ECF subfamily)
MTSQEERLSSLYAHNVDRVHGFLLARCGSPALAEDLTGVTFEEAAKAFARGKEDTVTPSWLLTVGRRRLIDHWRRAERLRRRMATLRAEKLTDDLRLVHPDTSISTDDRVMTALESLPTRQRAALTLRYLDDYSVSEVAATLETSYRSAESLLARARHAFKTAYEETS